VEKLINPLPFLRLQHYPMKGHKVKLDPDSGLRQLDNGLVLIPKSVIKEDVAKSANLVEDTELDGYLIHPDVDSDMLNAFNVVNDARSEAQDNIDKSPCK